MRQLLWKEWQERRCWLLLWVVAEVCTGLFTRTQSPFGLQLCLSFWLMVPLALAVLAGLGAYGSELSGERAAFLYSRALCWKQVLLAKVLLGLTVVVVAPVITAVLLRLTAPIDYVPFMTPAHLLLGTLWVMLSTGVAFIIGLSCSIIVAGLGGSLLALLGYMGIVLLAIVIYEQVPRNPAIPLAAFFMALLLAAMVIARFGITLSQDSRLRRFALIAFIPMIAGFLCELTPPARQFDEHTEQSWGYFTNFRISPSGNYVYVERASGDNVYAEIKGKDNTKQGYWVDVAKQRLTSLPSLSQTYRIDWTPNDCLLIWHRNVFTMNWQINGLLRSYHFSNGFVAQPFASPDGAKVLLPLVYSTEINLLVYDLQTDNMQSLPMSWPRDYWKTHHKEFTLAPWWWQSTDVIGCLDPLTGKHVQVKVVL